MSFKVIDTDNGFKAFVTNLEDASRSRVLIGAVGDRGDDIHPDAGITNAELLGIHEFGADVKNGFGRGINIKIPQRKPIRGTADANRAKYERHLEAIIAKMALLPRATDVESELRALGERVRGDVIDRIKEGLTPDLKPRTKRQKQLEGWPTTPLIRTGQLIGSIDVEVVG